MMRHHQAHKQKFQLNVWFLLLVFSVCMLFFNHWAGGKVNSHHPSATTSNANLPGTASSNPTITTALAVDLDRYENIDSDALASLLASQRAYAKHKSKPTTQDVLLDLVAASSTSTSTATTTSSSSSTATWQTTSSKVKATTTTTSSTFSGQEALVDKALIQDAHVNPEALDDKSFSATTTTTSSSDTIQQTTTPTTTTTTTTTSTTTTTQTAAKCKIYVLDPSTEFAASLGIPSCDITEDYSEHHNYSNLNSSDASTLPHWASKYSTGYWVSHAIRNGPHLTKNAETADLMYIDTHCYTSWYERIWQEQTTQPSESSFLGPFNEVAGYISRIFAESIFSMPQYLRTRGARLVISRPWMAAPAGVMLDTCATLHKSFILAGERGVFCSNDRDRAAQGDSLILPRVVALNYDSSVTAVGTVRPTFLYYYSTCPPAQIDSGGGGSDSAPLLLPDQALQQAVLQEKDRLGGDVSMSCGCRDRQCSSTASNNNKKRRSQAEEMALMRQTTFCLILPEGTQSGGSLTEAVLSGCIPVFIGEPFHALPLANDVDYTNFSVFFLLTTTTTITSVSADGEIVISSTTTSGAASSSATSQLPHNMRIPGELEPPLANSTTAVVTVPDLQAAVAHLRAIDNDQLKRMQASLDAVRTLFYYPPSPGFHTSPLSKLIVKRMCDYAMRAKEAHHQAWLARKDRPTLLPKIPKGGFQTEQASDEEEEQQEEEDGA